MGARRTHAAIRWGFIAGLLAAGPLAAATLEVTATADAVGADGQCTLREAISNANADQALVAGSGECAAGSGADTIMLGAGTYAIARAGAFEDLNATGDFDLRSPITLVGGGPGITRISGALQDRVLHVVGGGNVVALHQLTLSLGLLPEGPGTVERGGGGLLVGEQSEATLDHVVVEFNSAGSVTSATDFGGGNGGGILCLSNADVVVLDSIVRLNTAGDARAGSSSGGRGGGIAGVACSMRVERSRIERNTTGDGIPGVPPGPGGGIALVFTAVLDLVDSVVADNTVGAGGAADGGGVHGLGSTLRVSGSSLVGNRAGRGGGIAGSSFLTFAPWFVTLRNTTLGGNEATEGGAIHLTYGWVVDLLATTLADNAAGTGGAIALGACGSTLCSLRMADSAFVRNTALACALAGSATISLGHNAFETAGACGPFAATDRVVTADALGQRTDDYTTTPVYLPAPDGALVDGGSCTAAGVTVDQAGLTRPQQFPTPDAADGCDIGAIELREPGLFADGFD
jgi:CSLREA domain-containing protein